MFTGIIREVGSITSDTRTSGGAVLHIHCPLTAPELAIGDSVAVQGVCLTATVLESGGFSADVSRETLKRSSLGNLKPGAAVNIELPLRATGRFDGHIVQGHVDACGAIDTIRRDGEGWILGVHFPLGISRYIVEKGSIALDGISLTVARLEKQRLEVAVIPHTWRETSLREAATGNQVNIEVDILAKYVEKMVKQLTPGDEITEEFLTRHGFGRAE